MRVITFKIEESLLARLDYAAVREGVSRSDVIRKAIVEYLRKYHHAPARFKVTVKRVVIA